MDWVPACGEVEVKRLMAFGLSVFFYARILEYSWGMFVNHLRELMIYWHTSAQKMRKNA